MSKKFSETKLAKFLNKVKDIGLDVAPIVTKAGSGNVLGAISDTVQLLKGADVIGSSELLDELTIKKKSLELDFYRAGIEDRDSARKREIEMAKAGGTDWMMVATGVTGLVSFIFSIYAVVYIPDVKENELFIHLLGMIEGVVISNLFAYYYGTSVKK
jgi:uncharacterized protein YqhQ